MTEPGEVEAPGLRGVRVLRPGFGVGSVGPDARVGSVGTTLVAGEPAGPVDVSRGGVLCGGHEFAAQAREPGVAGVLGQCDEQALLDGAPDHAAGHHEGVHDQVVPVRHGDERRDQAVVVEAVPHA